MNTILSITFAALALQTISAIPESQIRLSPVYLSSQQEARLKLAKPTAIAIARSGNIYVFDDGTHELSNLIHEENSSPNLVSPAADRVPYVLAVSTILLLSMKMRMFTLAIPGRQR